MIQTTIPSQDHRWKKTRNNPLSRGPEAATI